MTTRRNSDTGSWMVGLDGAVMILIALIVVGFGARWVWLTIDTAQQPTVRTNITHQAPNVIANNNRLHQLCADVKQAENAQQAAALNLHAFKDSHTMAALSDADATTWGQLTDNANGATYALQEDLTQYDALIANTDINHDLDANLPTTSAGCR